MTEYINSAMQEAIEECVHNDMHREALRLRLLDGWAYERIAAEVDRTPRQVYNIMDKYTPALFDYIRGKKKLFFLHDLRVDHLLRLLHRLCLRRHHLLRLVRRVLG